MTLNKSMQTIAQHEIQQIPSPTQAKITRVYQDGYVDIITTHGELKHIQTITPHEVDDETILIFLNQTYDEKIVI